jgi:hypothetical protein
MEQFEDLQAWDLMVESRQYRANGGRGLNLRNVADFAFLDLLSLFILHNEYETAPIASKYADSTMGYRNFAKARLSGTDLYVSMNILSDPTSVFSRRITQNADADTILRSKLKLNLPTVKRYLDLLADGTITKDDTATLLLRMEKQLNITDSKLRSIRRLVQDWPGLNTMQRELATTKMLQYYKKFAKRSEIAVFLGDMARGKGYEMRGGIDAELANLGYTGRDAHSNDQHSKHDKHGHSWSKIASDLLPAAGFYAGYKLAKR